MKVCKDNKSIATINARIEVKGEVIQVNKSDTSMSKMTKENSIQKL